IHRDSPSSQNQRAPDVPGTQRFAVDRMLVARSTQRHTLCFQRLIHTREARSDHCLVQGVTDQIRQPQPQLPFARGFPSAPALPTIKRAYRRLVFSVYPDLAAAPDPKRFYEIDEAYEILTDPERRRSGTRAEAELIYRRQMVVEPKPLSARRRAIKVPDDFA